VRDIQASQFNDDEINALKAGLNEIAQGCLNLIRALAVSQIPESDKTAVELGEHK